MFSTKLAVAVALAGLGVSASAAQAQVPIPVSDPGNAGPGTLRAAINQANMSANLNEIVFKLPAAGTVITPAANLPPLMFPVEIDGYSQPGSAPASATTPAVPGVVIDAVNTTRALQVNANDSLVQGLAIHDSSGAAAGPDGIRVTGNANRIEGNHIGTDAAGASMGMWNLSAGVEITGGQGNVVGGPLPEDANVIAEIDGDGVAITANANTVVGNRLGLPYGGGLGNFANGVSVSGAMNHVGAMSTGGRNVISENNGHGVLITGNGNAVEGNYVGLDETGADGPGNVQDGIHVAGNQNVVQGNAAGDNDAGVALNGANNLVIGNALGLDAAMQTEVGNDDGVLVLAGNANVIGGDEEHERNVISGNADSGVEIDAGANNRVEGNQVGSEGLANDDGVLVESSNNFVMDNVVAGNRDAGVKLDGGAAGPPIQNTVDGNDVTGNEKGIVVEDSHRNAISGNAVSDNLDEGVLIEAFQLANANENRLTGNTITDNGLSGVRIEGGDDNAVGVVDGDVNTITGNAGDGVTVESGQDNVVVNNSISENGDLGIDLAADGATTNDGLLDPDAGPNGLQNHPTISGRTLHFEVDPEDPLGGRLYTVVSWTLRTTAATDYRLEFYGMQQCDGSGRGEAPALIATQDVATDAAGLATGTVRFPTASVSAAIAATATVTDPNGVVLGPTSELSPCG